MFEVVVNFSRVLLRNLGLMDVSITLYGTVHFFYSSYHQYWLAPPWSLVAATITFHGSYHKSWWHGSLFWWHHHQPPWHEPSQLVARFSFFMASSPTSMAWTITVDGTLQFFDGIITNLHGSYHNSWWHASLFLWCSVIFFVVFFTFLVQDTIKIIGIHLL